MGREVAGRAGSGIVTRIFGSRAGGASDAVALLRPVGGEDFKGGVLFLIFITCFFFVSCHSRDLGCF